MSHLVNKSVIKIQPYLTDKTESQGRSVWREKN